MASAIKSAGLSDAQPMAFLAPTKKADSLELKLTVPMSDRRLTAFLTQHDNDLSGDQETKTKKALQFHAKRLQVEAVESSTSE